jgi:hypothetical protein
MNQSNSTTFPTTTAQFTGIESTNTTRLLVLKSWKADLNNHAVDKTWILEKANHRSYLQQRISLQQLKIWNMFRTVPKSLKLVLGTTSIDIFPGNWDHESLAAFVTSKLTNITMTWDPYNLQFVICPPTNIGVDSTANKLFGFPDGPQLAANISEFPPVDLFGPPYINIHTNFTMNNIPASEYLCSVPLTSGYGSHIFYYNTDNSMSTLVLDPDINHIRVILSDHKGNLLEYSDELDWEIVLAMQAVIPEGFAPLES